jgi:hypothetical protein
MWETYPLLAAGLEDVAVLLDDGLHTTGLVAGGDDELAGVDLRLGRVGLLGALLDLAVALVVEAVVFVFLFLFNFGQQT